jgi:hypothetical protein
MLIYESAQFFDDVVDGDKVSRETAINQLLDMWIRQHLNPFFEQYRMTLIPQLSTMILKWQASDDVERSGKASAKSYMWRAGYYDIVLAVCQLCFGYENAAKLGRYVLDLYGETFEEYTGEFKCLIP